MCVILYISTIFVLHMYIIFKVRALLLSAIFFEAGKMVHPSISLVTGWTKGDMKVRLHGVYINYNMVSYIFLFRAFFPRDKSNKVFFDSLNYLLFMLCLV